MCKSKKSIEAMAEEIRKGDYSDFGRLLYLCAYIPSGTFAEAEKLGYEKEDIRQEAVIAFLHALHSFDEQKGAGFRSYASACIKNHIASILRSGNRTKSRAMLDYVPIDELDIASENEPESDWIEKEAVLDMKKRITEILSDFEKEVLELYLKGFSYKTIGEKLGKTEKSIGNALSRVRKKLRSEMAPED
ncbi:MAG: sigma-70 family RNA polymerase sigma factor [Oscillospiraceae bacterium]|nr:sigma-70 family RNA polymerase sigma factor [Oscillospiraceae bacterium]